MSRRDEVGAVDHMPLIHIARYIEAARFARNVKYTYVIPSDGIATGRSADLIPQARDGMRHASRRDSSVRAGLAHRSG